MSLFLISAVRAVVEMLGLCLLAQGALYFFAGQRRNSNRIYQLFALLTQPPKRIIGRLLPGSPSGRVVGIATFGVLLLLWLGLAFVRKFV